MVVVSAAATRRCGTASLCESASEGRAVSEWVVVLCGADCGEGRAAGKRCMGRARDANHAIVRQLEAPHTPPAGGELACCAVPVCASTRGDWSSPSHARGRAESAGGGTLRGGEPARHAGDGAHGAAHDACRRGWSAPTMYCTSYKTQEYTRILALSLTLELNRLSWALTGLAEQRSKTRVGLKKWFYTDSGFDF
jgi:hypothetical protein